MRAHLFGVGAAVVVEHIVDVVRAHVAAHALQVDVVGGLEEYELGGGERAADAHELCAIERLHAL